MQIVELQGPLESIVPLRDWEDSRLELKLRENIASTGFGKTSVVESYAISSALEGQDVVVVGQRGRTAALVVPCLELALRQTRRSGTRSSSFASVLVTSTQERVAKLFSAAQRFARGTGLRLHAADSRFGLPAGTECDVLISTSDALGAQSDVSFSNLAFLGVDQADEELKVQYLINAAGREKQRRRTMIFASYWNRMMENLAEQFLANDFISIVPKAANLRWKSSRPGKVLALEDNPKLRAISLEPSAEEVPEASQSSQSRSSKTRGSSRSKGSGPAERAAPSGSSSRSSDLAQREFMEGYDQITAIANAEELPELKMDPQALAEVKNTWLAFCAKKGSAEEAENCLREHLMDVDPELTQIFFGSGSCGSFPPRSSRGASRSRAVEPRAESRQRSSSRKATRRKTTLLPQQLTKVGQGLPATTVSIEVKAPPCSLALPLSVQRGVSVERPAVPVGGPVALLQPSSRIIGL